MPRLKRWRELASREVFSAPPWIKVFRQKVRLPDGRKINDYHRIELADYAMAAAQTADGRFVFLRMYKHAAGRVGLYLPTGEISRGETPLQAAKRELFEETGYRATHWRKLGSFVCNANYGCGTAHLFIAGAAQRAAQPDSGDLEEMEVTLLNRAQTLNALRRGAFPSLSGAAAVALAIQRCAD